MVPRRGVCLCERARRAGYRLYPDTTIRLGHVGSYAYTWEDACRESSRYESYVYRVTRSTPTGP